MKRTWTIIGVSDVPSSFKQMAASPNRNDWLLAALLLWYVVASLVHFTHNAEYLNDYPNLPPWLTRGGVYLAWLGETSLGILGYVLYRSGWRLTGLALVGVYAAFGFDGLLHYIRAPFDAHTFGMNFTILFEVVAAALLLARVLLLAWILRPGGINLSMNTARPRPTFRVCGVLRSSIRATVPIASSPSVSPIRNPVRSSSK